MNVDRQSAVKGNFENLLFNTLKLVGVGSYWKKFPEEAMMLIGRGGFEVLPAICANYPCSEKCDGECDLCPQCLNEDEKHSMKLAYLEATNIGEFKRIFPVSIVSLMINP